MSDIEKMPIGAMGDLSAPLKLMTLNTVEAIVKLNTKISACLASNRAADEKQEKLDTYEKKLMNLVYILYAGKEFARNYLQEEHKEYLYILDFVERKYKEAGNE